MRLIFIHGRPAVGKFTVATELARLTQFALFHNHLTVDLLLAVFPFGSPELIRWREEIWLGVMQSAAQVGRNLIFTFNPEKTVSPGFPDRLAQIIRSAGGTVDFVELVCTEGELERRLETPGRRLWRKLASVEEYRRLGEEGTFSFPPLPAGLTLETTALTPGEAARCIAAQLKLPIG